MYRRNADEEKRRLERLSNLTGDVYDQAAFLQRRIRHGELDPHYVELAAYLGDLASLQLFPNPQLPEIVLREGETLWPTPSHEEWWATPLKVIRRGNLSYSFLATAAADFVEHTIHYWNDFAPTNYVPARTFELIRNYLRGHASIFEIRQAVVELDALLADHSEQSRPDGPFYAARAIWDLATNLESSDPLEWARLVPNTMLDTLFATRTHSESAYQAEIEWQRQYLIRRLLA
jgi:hypothetical protein